MEVRSELLVVKVSKQQLQVASHRPDVPILNLIIFRLHSIFQQRTKHIISHLKVHTGHTNLKSAEQAHSTYPELSRASNLVLQLVMVPFSKFLLWDQIFFENLKNDGR